ncbi:hypothetical protein B0H11DRAFT_1949369 [Mycena galericulata]|nr:hypothetical protein B0H11DRAFT_1949369 [Mycena galericulata]
MASSIFAVEPNSFLPSNINILCFRALQLRRSATSDFYTSDIILGLAHEIFLRGTVSSSTKQQSTSLCFRALQFRPQGEMTHREAKTVNPRDIIFLHGPQNQDPRLAAWRSEVREDASSTRDHTGSSAARTQYLPTSVILTVRGLSASLALNSVSETSRCIRSLLRLQPISMS